MAIFTPSESPAVVVKEIDLTGSVPNIQSTTGAFVGNFRWGPVAQPIPIDSEQTLASVFATPTAVNAVDFMSAAYFLKYSSSLRVVRMISASAQNAISRATGDTDVVVNNRDDFENQYGAFSAVGTNVGAFIAKYPGALGNSLRIELCSASPDVPHASLFNNWAYKSLFDGPPLTSAYAATRGGTRDEIHMVIIDEDGKITGTKGTILETFAFMSLAGDAKTDDGASNYIVSVINARSKWVWLAQTDVDLVNLTNIGMDAGNRTFVASVTATFGFSLRTGIDSGVLTNAAYATGFATMEDVNNISVDFLIAPSMLTAADQATVVNNLTVIAASTRKDCIVVTSPNRLAVVANPAPIADIVACFDGVTHSTYVFADNNFLKVYDKYNDQFIFIPAASSTAGLMAASDFNAAPWYSPAGSRRGVYLGVTSLAYSPSKAQRDILYKASVNPIASIPGEGVMLFGDKTHSSRPSAFDRINVRRLFIVLERAIGIAARNVMFEFNDEFTRAEFVNNVEPFLRGVQGRRGITNFRVVADETNNTPDVIDRNEFRANIFIMPARSINYVTLNFVAVRSGIDFTEIAGSV